MSGEICTDNRFKTIEAYKKMLLERTNIETSPDEMSVIDNILFRFWQMGWLAPLPHGRLVDADKLHDAMYHRAFETDGDTMWQSGYWVRYRAIEQTMDAAPTVIPREE